MYISLFFDVEDCITPASDDIAKDLADIMSAQGLVGNFMVVGDKARVLESRGRQDVIRAISRHEIGLHSNRHSRHPTVAEYLEDKNWDDGIAEAVRQEGPGVDTLQRLFGQMPSCWGQPGGSWGPQIHPALKQLGVPLIVYPETYTPSSDIHWYAGTLTFGYRRFFEGFDLLYSESEKFQKHFQAFQERVETYLQADYEWMGLFCGHPITIRAYEFGDVLNFGRGKETPPALWQQPPLKSEAAYQTALHNFARLVRYIATHPRLQVVPVGALSKRFMRVSDSIDHTTLLDYAKTACRAGEILVDDPNLSPAEAIDLMLQALLTSAKEARQETFVRRNVGAPLHTPPDHQHPLSLTWDEFSAMCENVHSFIARTGRLPAAVKVDKATIGVGGIYRAACQALVAQADRHTQHTVAIAPGPQTPAIADAISERTEAGYRGWVIHKSDLKTTKLLELTRLQTWTLNRATFS